MTEKNNQTHNAEPLTVEQKNWQYDLNRFLHETTRHQQEGSNLPSIISEKERLAIGIFYTLNQSFLSQEAFHKNLKETGSKKVSSIEKGEEMHAKHFETFLYERLKDSIERGNLAESLDKLSLKDGKEVLKKRGCKACLLIL